MSDDREAILSRVRNALLPLKKRAAPPDWDPELAVMREAKGAVDPWALFSERLAALKGVHLDSVTKLVALLEKNDGKRGYCDPSLWPELRDAFPPGFIIETDFDRARVDDYHFGITAAAGAIAETGTIILTDAGTSRRLGSLAPWIHVAVLHRETIFADLPAAVAALPDDPNIVWCTGPSRTADVEGILIEGVHGPGIQAALLSCHEG